MKKIFAMLLVLAMVLALAACGGTKEADVVTNVDPENNNVVIETPNVVVSGTENTPDPYPAVSILPTTAPTTVPVANPSSAPVPSTAPGGNNGGGNTGDNNNNTEKDPDDGLKQNNPTVTQYELDHGKDAYVANAENGVYFRVGPSSEYEIITGLKNGTKVLLVDELASGWCKVVYDGDVGYIFGKYLSFTNPLESNATVVSPSPSPSESPTQEPAPTAVVIP